MTLKKKLCLLLVMIIKSKCNLFNPVEQQDIILINLIYAAILRAQGSLAYINAFITTQQELILINNDMLAKIKNPSVGREYFSYPISTFIKFKETIEKTELYFYNYKILLNNLYKLLSEEEKKTWLEIKNTIKNNIMNEILKLQFIIDFFYNLGMHFIKRTNIKDINPYQTKNIFNLFTKKYTREFLYDFFYSHFENIQNTIQSQILNTTYAQFLKIWTIVEEKRIEEYTTIYNNLLLEYYKKNKSFPDKISYQEQNYYCHEKLYFL